MNSQYLALFATIIVDSGLRPSGFKAQANLLMPISTSKNVLVQCSQRSLFLQVASDVPPPPDRGAPDGRTDGASRNTNYSLFFKETVLVNHQEDPPLRESG